MAKSEEPMEFTNYIKTYDEWINHYQPSLTIENFNASPISRKLTLQLSRNKAIDYIKNNFDINRSFNENNGHVSKLKEDLLAIYWHKVRCEFPTREDYDNHYNVATSTQDKYSNTYFDKYIKFISEKKHISLSEYRRIRKRGADKRALKEKQLREKIGDSEFNRRMVIDKDKKSKKGGTDKQYLDYLEWRDSASAQKFFKISKESDNINVVKLSYIIPMYSNTTTKRVSHTDIIKILIYVLNKNYRTIITMVEGCTPEDIPHQYVLLENTKLNITSAKRSTSISGTILRWHTNNSKLLVSFDKYTSNYYQTYPKQWSNFENYTDPTTRTYVGNPKIKTKAHLFYAVCGKSINATIYIPETSTILTLKTDGYLKYTSYEEIISLCNINNNIKDRLKQSIKADKQAKATSHKNKNKNKNNSDLDKLIELGKLKMEGLISDDEWNRQKKKLNI